MTEDHPAWPERTLFLAAGGALFGFLFDRLTGGGEPEMWADSAEQMAAATFLAVSGIAFALSLERLRWTWSAAFAAAAGVIAALIGWWNGPPQGWGADEGWHFFAAIAAIVLAVPLFQSARDAGQLRFEPRAVHAHLWSDLILWVAACAFVGAAFLLTLLLSELFHLIGLDFLRDLMRESWFRWTLACGALGAAIGLLRERDQVLGVLQRVVRAILSVLAPVRALGLLVFVLALPFTGLEPLWSQTKSTTPILLFCVLAGVVLANAVIGNAPDEEARAPLLRYAVMALIAVLLPLATVAAISTGKRIGQYGYTPDRLWACVFILAATAFAVSYLAALVRGRAAWPEQLRRANVGLAIGLSLLALFLAAPILSFGAISARDQLARLESGQTPPDRFDWAAMRFDFGPAGVAALQRLARSAPSAAVRHVAASALARTDRYEVETQVQGAAEMAVSPRSIEVRPVPVPVPADLEAAILPGDLNPNRRYAKPCTGPGECVLFWRPGQETAIVMLDGCAVSVVGREGQLSRNSGCEIHFTVLERKASGWAEAQFAGAGAGRPPSGPESDAEGIRREREAIERGDVEIREVVRRQLFVGGKPVSGLFE